MTRIRPAVISLLLLASAALALPPAGDAAKFDAGGFHFLSSQLTVNENAGSAVITVTRSDTSRGAQVRYITIGLTAQAPYDYRPVKSMLSFAPGLAAAPPSGDPLTGAHFFVDPHSETAKAARRHAALRVIADQPGTARFGSFSYPPRSRASSSTRPTSTGRCTRSAGRRTR